MKGLSLALHRGEIEARAAIAPMVGQKVDQ
jgi:hypothetical protein